MTNIITITTDFGDQFAAAQLKAVAYATGFSGQLVENHGVTPFSIVEGAFQIQVTSRYTTGGVHVGVVDPGVGSRRRGIIVETRKGWLVGPDNGLLWPAAKEQGAIRYWMIYKKCFGDVANTFHGRDVFIKAATWLSQGQLPGKFGCKQVKRIKRLVYKQGQVLHIDAYGNIKFNWQGKLEKAVKTFSDVNQGEPLVYWGSSNTYELAINQGNAAEHFGVKLGQVLEEL